jgi:hypothetical protein
MANLKKLQAALAKKQADLDVMDDQIMGMPEMAPEAPANMAVSPEFDLLSEKREELEEEIRQMREGVELISQWEKFKDGPWSEQIKGLLGEIDIEISDIAGGEVAAADELGGIAPAPGLAAPAPLPEAAPVPEAAIPPAPEALPAEPAPAPEIPAAEPAAEPAPLEPPTASVTAAKKCWVCGQNPGNDPNNQCIYCGVRQSKDAIGKKNSYASPVKKGVSARSDTKKEGSNMANSTPAKASVQEKLAEVKTKREAIRREAQQRVAAAWTIAKTMLPTAPAEAQKDAASSLLSNSTKVLNAMLRQTAKNAHYSKLAETFKQVHKVELNDALEDPSVLSSLKKEVAAEVKGDPKNAAVEKKADDRKDAGPQTETYNDGRGAGGGKHTEPKPMDAGTSASQTEAANRPENTVNKSEGDGKAASKAAAAPKKAEAECKCEGPCKCGAKEAAAKKADETIDAPAGDVPPVEEAPIEEAPEALGEAPVEEAPIEEAPADLPVDEGAEADTAGEVLSDEKKMVVEEKIEEAQEAIKALEQEILQEGEEELDLAKVFNEDEIEEKVSALANEGEEHVAGNGEEYFAPSAAESMEASLDDTQIASMEDFFSLQGSDSDPLRALIAGEVRTAAEVAGMEVVPSFTGEAAKHFESDSATGESRDNENDHEGDLFAEAIEDQKPEDGGFKRVKQDETNVLQAPKSSSAKAANAAAPAKEKVAEKVPVIKKLKNITASEQKPFDIAGALLGDDEF